MSREQFRYDDGVAAQCALSTPNDNKTRNMFGRTIRQNQDSPTRAVDNRGRTKKSSEAIQVEQDSFAPHQLTPVTNGFSSGGEGAKMSDKHNDWEEIDYDRYHDMLLSKSLSWTDEPPLRCEDPLGCDSKLYQDAKRRRACRKDPYCVIGGAVMVATVALAMFVAFGLHQGGRGAAPSPNDQDSPAPAGSTGVPTTTTVTNLPAMTRTVAPTKLETVSPTIHDDDRNNVFLPPPPPSAMPTPLSTSILAPTPDPTDQPSTFDQAPESITGASFTPSSLASLKDYWTLLIIGSSPSTSRSFRNSTSPQSLALLWMMQDPFSLSNFVLEEGGAPRSRFLQRFATVTIWYALGGSNRTFGSADTAEWPQPTSECEWSILECNRVNEVEVLVLDGYENRDDGLFGTLPAELGLMTMLKELRIVSIRALQGTIPASLGLLTRLTSLDLSNNNLSGPIPTQIGKLTNLGDEVSLMRNDLAGPLPSELGQLVKLKILHIFDNHNLTSTLPSELGQLVRLSSMHLHSNHLTGSIPTELGQLVDLNVLYLWDNHLTGRVPTEIGYLSANLGYLVLSSNNLSGHVPTELGKLTNLLDLKVRYNNMTGPLPTELGQLSVLLTLLLSQNNLTGSIPTELGQLTSTTKLELHSNNLTGPLPLHLGNLTHLERIYLYDNDGLWGTVPSSLCLNRWFFAYVDCDKVVCSCTHLGTNARCFDGSLRSCTST